MDEQTLQGIETRLTRTKKRHFSDSCWETYDQDVNRLVGEVRKHAVEHATDPEIRRIEMALETTKEAIATTTVEDSITHLIREVESLVVRPTWANVERIGQMIGHIKKLWQQIYVGDVEYLLGAVKGLEGVITDLTNDSVAFAEGQKQAYGRILDLLRRRREDILASGGREVHAISRTEEVASAINEVLILAGVSPGERPTPLPNEELRLENERLRLENEKLKLQVSHPD